MRGDHYDSWGASTYFFEVGDDGYPSRQLEIYESGRTLRYSPDHLEDEYGQLANVQLDALEDWSPWAISEEEFEQAWSSSS